MESQKCPSHRLPLKKKRTLSRGSVKKPTIIQKKLETELLYFISFLVQIIAIDVSGGLFLPIVFSDTLHRYGFRARDYLDLVLVNTS